MIILIAYSTIEGQTGKIAGRMAETVERAGHQVVLADLREPGFAIPARFDAVILAAPIHLQRYPGPFVSFVQNWKSALMEKPCALVTVSLAIHSDDPGERAEAEAYPEILALETGWAPKNRHHAAGALKYVEYDFFKRWIMRRIAAKEGGPVDTSRDHEFTDWSALDEFVMGFLSEAGRPAA